MIKFLLTLLILAMMPIAIVSAGEEGKYILLENSIIGGETSSPSNFLEYASLIFKTILSVTIALAILYIIIGGIQYVLAASSLGKEDGKGRIKDALTGLLLALVSWLILYTINPDLVEWKLCVPKLPSTECGTTPSP